MITYRTRIGRHTWGGTRKRSPENLKGKKNFCCRRLEEEKLEKLSCRRVEEKKNHIAKNIKCSI
tara:strand:- start:348 stop:539 length:192 start_codon:yes stop_codon:yes gene_type:complete